jgi:chromosome partitioning protein
MTDSLLFMFPCPSGIARHVGSSRRGRDVAQVGLLSKPGKHGSAGPSTEARAPQKNAAKWLVIASGKGGTTKTTTTLNLATIAAASGLGVGLLDMDEQETLTKWYQRRARQPDVARLALFTVPLAEISRAIREVEMADGLDLIIVDTPPGLEQRIRVSELIRRADFVLVPSTQGTADVDSAIEFMAVTSALGVKASFLLSRTNQRWGSYRTAKRLLNRSGPLCPVDVRHLRDIEATHDYGLGINEFQGVKGVDDLEAVWDFARGMMGL